MKEIIYIAGPMTGVENKNRDAFMKAERYLRETRGAAVLNPACLPDDLPITSYMPICLAMLAQADTIALLPMFWQSKGAEIEKRFAEYQGYKLIFMQDEYGREEAGGHDASHD